MNVSNFLIQGNIQYPDGTTQSTNNIVNAPNGLTGSLGDKKGNIAYGDNCIYYCVQDFVPILSYNISFYRHSGQMGYFSVAQNGHTFTSGDSIVNWVISDAFEDDISVNVPDNTYVMDYYYADNGSIIDWNGNDILKCTK